MPEVAFSPLADLDIDEIYEYSLQQFGEQVADRYYTRLFERCDIALRNPGLAKSEDSIVPNLKRISYEAHMIYFVRNSDGGIHVIRILHQSMDPKRHI